MDLVTTVRRAALEAMHLTGAARLVEPLTGGRGLIFMLHHVRQPVPGEFAPNAHLEVTPGFLDRVIRLAKARGFEFVPLSAVPERLSDPSRTGRRFAAFTLDDGYADNHDQAWPVFRAHGVPFTVFVTTGFVDRTAALWWRVAERALGRLERLDLSVADEPKVLRTHTPGEKRAAFKALAAFAMASPEPTVRAMTMALGRAAGLDPLAITDKEAMTWPQVVRLATDPLATIGGHTVTHARLAALDPEAARREMADGAARLERMLGTRPRTFAYPYGGANAAGEREARLAAAEGFALAVTTCPGTLPRSAAATPLRLPRVSLNGLHQREEATAVLMTGAPFALAAAARALRSVPRRLGRVRSPASAVRA